MLCAAGGLDVWRSSHLPALTRARSQTAVEPTMTESPPPNQRPPPSPPATIDRPASPAVRIRKACTETTLRQARE